MIRIATLALTTILMAGTAAWSGEIEGLELAGGLPYADRAELANSGKGAEGRSIFLPWGLDLARSRQFLGLPEGSPEFSCLDQKRTPGLEACFIGPVWTGRLGNSSYPYKVGLSYFHGRLFAFHLIFDNDDFSSVRRNLEGKLGSAASEDESWYQPGRSAEKHLQTELFWQTEDTEVTLVRRTEYDVTEGEISATYQPVAKMVPSAAH